MGSRRQTSSATTVRPPSPSTSDVFFSHSTVWDSNWEVEVVASERTRTRGEGGWGHCNDSLPVSTLMNCKYLIEYVRNVVVGFS